MAKAADMRSALLAGAGSTAAEKPAPTISRETRALRVARSRIGKSNVTGYYPSAVKKQLRIMAAEKETTIQNLLAEALNDLFAKHGPARDRASRGRIGMVPDIKTANIYQITKADLIDNTRLGDLYVHAVREGLWSNGNRFMLEFVALAEKALADDKNGTPGVLFASLLRREGVGRYVTNACEARALLRFSSESRERWVSAAALQPPPVSQPELFDLDSLDNLGFCHSILMQCFLPQGRKPGLTYTQQHGKVSLMIEAGWCIDPKRPGRFMRSRIPHGSRARLIMHYVMTEAVRTQSEPRRHGAVAAKLLATHRRADRWDECASLSPIWSMPSAPPQSHWAVGKKTGLKSAVRGSQTSFGSGVSGMRIKRYSGIRKWAFRRIFSTR